MERHEQRRGKERGHRPHRATQPRGGDGVAEDERGDRARRRGKERDHELGAEAAARHPAGKQQERQSVALDRARAGRCARDVRGDVGIGRLERGESPEERGVDGPVDAPVGEPFGGEQVVNLVAQRQRTRLMPHRE